jgi:phage/plasmid-associated DNA primase
MDTNKKSQGLSFSPEKNNGYQKSYIVVGLKGLRNVLETKEIYESDESKIEKEDFLKASDPIRKFVQEKCIKNVRSKVKKQFLYKAYEDLCGETDQWRLSKTMFYKKLLEANHDIYTKRPYGTAWYFMGIDLKEID